MAKRLVALESRSRAFQQLLGHFMITLHRVPANSGVKELRRRRLQID